MKTDYGKVIVISDDNQEDISKISEPQLNFLSEQIANLINETQYKIKEEYDAISRKCPTIQ